MRKREVRSNLWVLCFCMVFMFVFPGIAAAGPGGIIAKPLNAILWLIAIILFPFYLYVVTKENFAARRTKKALEKLTIMNGNFRWPVINERAHAIVSQVYSAWNKGDIERAQEWMTDWYWQNQKMTVLEQWENEGLKNYCLLKKINYIKPLYIDYFEEEPGDAEGSRISLLVEVKVKDYLVNEKTGKRVEGKKKFVNHETVWTLVLENEKWKLTLIEDSSMSLDYAKMTNNIEMAIQHLDLGLKYKKRI